MVSGSRQRPTPVKKAARASGDAGGGDAAGSDVRRHETDAAAGTPDERQQAAMYDRGIKLFHAGDYGSARPLFDAAARGPMAQMAHSARLHSQMCSRRIAAAAPMLRTADERYDYAIALINARRLDEAERYLMEAAAQFPRGDHIYYALALCRGLAGDLQAAYVNLKHAIDLQPRNRVHARNDPDFADIAHLPPLRQLLYP